MAITRVVVLALLRLGGLGCGSITGRVAIPQVSILSSARGLQGSCPGVLYHFGDAPWTVRSESAWPDDDVHAEISLPREEGAPLSTSCGILGQRGALDRAC